eukprot:TRINITY_DN29454_c0_g1_i1.p1 TRINITY_DN29454_c0_g1~~TRINITY_DN29454_c0_g1_i1.p1  ORF type:complete len:154 (+),score=41.60 TRINITY_DN29454_c0_g1_i1:56-517(+)
MAIFSETIPPLTKWAQREDKLFITIQVYNTNSDKSRQVIKEDMLEFVCVEDRKGKESISYLLELNFFAKIDPTKTLKKENDREIIFVFFKLKNEFWPRLTTSEKKLHYLKTDFDKWLDPDDSGDEAEKEKNLDKLMEAMGQVSQMNDDTEDTN